MMLNKLKKIEGMEIKKFLDLLEEKGENKEIELQKARLIPSAKQSELALTSVFLSALRLVKEFRQMFLNEIGISNKSGEFFYFVEVNFKKCGNKCTKPDGMLLQVKSGKIKNAVIFEVKNGKDPIRAEQIEDYLKIAKDFNISKVVTISNQFVTIPTLSPVAAKPSKYVKLYHFSWTTLLTMGQILLYDNDTNIEDEDQIEILNEVLHYFKNERSGISGFTAMKKGWKEISSKLKTDCKISKDDKDVIDVVDSWQQEEKELALILSNNLGMFVKLKLSNQYKKSPENKFKDSIDFLIKEKKLVSVYQIEKAISDLKVEVDFSGKSVAMEIESDLPDAKTVKGQLGWIRKQYNRCKNTNTAEFEEIASDLSIKLNIKHSRGYVLNKWKEFDYLNVEVEKGKKINDFKIVYCKDLNKDFSSTRNFIKIIEKMIIDFYRIIVQNIEQPKQEPPKMKPKEDKQDVE